MRRSIARRLVVMFALVALATFSLIGAVLHGVLQRELTRHQEDDLRTNLRNMRYTMERFANSERWPRMTSKMDTLTPDDGSVRFWVMSSDPRFEYGTGLAQAERISQEPDGRGLIVLAPGGPSFRTLSQTIPAFEDRPPVRLIVGVDMAPFDRTLRTFSLAMALVSLAAMALVMALGGWIARIGLGPVRELSKEARALRPKTRSQRLRMDDLPVELGDLSAAFNGALGRLEDAYEQLEAFNADVAHELRTPLANMIGGTQVMLSRKRSAPELEEALQSNLEELERLRHIVNDMLFLARADQGEAATGLAQADVAQEVALTIEFFEPLLEDAGMAVAVEGEPGTPARMNVALFRRALSNLLQNAIDHSPAGARLTVRIATRDKAVWIAVSNPGEAIDRAHLPRLFDRFYRVDTARRDAGERHGHGLGLAIVKAVAGMHGGAVEATSAAGTTTVAFSLSSTS